MASELSFWKPGDAAPSRGKSTPKVKSGGMSKKVMNMKVWEIICRVNHSSDGCFSLCSEWNLNAQHKNDHEIR